MSSSSDIGRVPVLDGWRGLAILMVVFHNASFVAPSFDLFLVKLARVALQAGWVGVTLFFVLSGYLITGILLDSVGRPRYLSSFYIRRTLRIFPLYYGFLILTLLVVPLLVRAPIWQAQTEGDALYYWLYVSNWFWLVDDPIVAFSHLWSLAVEEQFYLVWPFLVLLTGRDRFVWAAAAIVVGALVTRWLLLSADHPPPVLYTFTLARMDALALGALLAAVVRRPGWLEVLWRHRHLFAGASFAGLLAVVLPIRSLDPYAPLVLGVGQSAVALAFTAAMFLTLRPGVAWERGVTTALSAPWLRSLGKYSYAIYLFHFPLVTLTRDPVRAVIADAELFRASTLSLAYMLGILTAATVLAFGSWHLFEKRFLLLKDRWAPRPDAPAPA